MLPIRVVPLRSVAIWPVALTGLVLGGFGYWWTNQSAAMASTLPLTALDYAIPFWPGSGWVYACNYLFIVVAFLRLDGGERKSRFIYAMLASQLFAVMVFAIWPVRFPREVFPIPLDAAPVHRALAGWWRLIDQPVNCLPSLHVSTSVLCVAAFPRCRGWGRHVLAWVAAVCISLSTLTFKQHYVVDVLAGLALGLAAYGVFFGFRNSAFPVPAGLGGVQPGGGKSPDSDTRAVASRLDD